MSAIQLVQPTTVEPRELDVVAAVTLPDAALAELVAVGRQQRINPMPPDGSPRHLCQSTAPGTREVFCRCVAQVPVTFPEILAI